MDSIRNLSVNRRILSTIYHKTTWRKAVETFMIGMQDGKLNTLRLELSTSDAGHIEHSVDSATG